MRLQLSTLPSQYGLAAEEARFSAQDGTSISAWVVRHPNPQGLLIFLHGFGSSKTDLLDVAGSLYRAGRFSMILLDFRGHGDSGPGEVSFGFRETQEVKAAIDFAASDPGLKDLPVGCWGLSMGGAIAMLSASRFPEIRAVVADSAYADMGKAIARAQWLTYHIPRAPLGQLVIWAVQWKLRSKPGVLDPVKVVGRIAPRPIFFIHGGNDATIPSSEGLALYHAAGEPKTWWLVPEAEHATCYYERTEEYVRKVTEFFENELRRPS